MVLATEIGKERGQKSLCSKNLLTFEFGDFIFRSMKLSKSQTVVLAQGADKNGMSVHR